MLQEVFTDTVFVWKKEIKYLPFFGWALAAMPMIETDRSASKSSAEAPGRPGPRSPCQRLHRDHFSRGHALAAGIEKPLQGRRRAARGRDRHAGGSGGAQLGRILGPQRPVQAQRHRHRQHRPGHRSGRTHRRAKSRSVPKTGSKPRWRRSARSSTELPHEPGHAAARNSRCGSTAPSADPAAQLARRRAAGVISAASLRLVLGTTHSDSAARRRHAGTCRCRRRQRRARFRTAPKPGCARKPGGVLQQVIGQKSALAGRRAPRLALSFAARGHWVEVQGSDTLRCNWRLIEQPLAVIEQAVARGIAACRRRTAASIFSACRCAIDPT